MSKHKLNPSQGETWYHPITFNAYHIHSITDDGWVRYRPIKANNQVLGIGPLLTEPALDFIARYKRQEVTNA